MKCMEKRRSWLLDIFRIILCIGVVVYHYRDYSPASGSFMVNGFMVMSGFLVGVMLLRTEQLDVVKFYNGKIRRLLPMLLVAFLLGVFVVHGVRRMPPVWDGFAWGDFSVAKFMLQYNTPLWFMWVEFIMLFMVPFFFYLSKSRWALPAFVAACTLLAVGLYMQVPYCAPFGQGLYYSPVARCWQFGGGILSALLWGRIQRRGVAESMSFKCITACLFIVFVGLGVAMMVLRQWKHFGCWNYTVDFDLLSVGFFAVLIPCIFCYRMAANHKAAVLLGHGALLTYPIFLLHIPVQTIVSCCLGVDVYAPVCQLYSVLGTIAAAELLLLADSYVQRSLAK